ncbi:Multidomain scavenger receptor protein PbSR (Precursor), related [Eimeria brunetti]|uniref:Multidomain scavenger receptor protein PbSR (Precursor), related n=1 Tax=Eimeria brunetti TaxID=51314 RepID=U6LDS6_9EIME|nr:Multidomain scavenger receptor protein PbSR (Precursor), related [Eimeria brunetti]
MVEIHAEKFDAAASFSTAKRLVQLYVNGQPVASEKVDFDLNLRGRMIVGRASAAEADYFEGDILGIKVFNEEIPIATIRSALTPETLAAHLPQAPSESRRTEDGRLCLSPCSFQGPQWAAAAAAAAEAAGRSIRPAVSLSCSNCLRRPEFNGPLGHQFLVLCPPDCLHVNSVLEGCSLYSARSSICRAALHAGALPREGGEALVTVAAGLTAYDASQGHFGGLYILSCFY